MIGLRSDNFDVSGEVRRVALLSVRRAEPIMDGVRATTFHIFEVKSRMQNLYQHGGSAVARE